MAYFEMTLINGVTDRHDFDISVNESLYNYLTCHENAKTYGSDWFGITLNETDVETIQKLCKTNEEKELIGKNVRTGTIIDVLIHRTILLGDD